MRYPLIALALALVGFAGSLGCFLPPGTRAPRSAPPAPTAGPRWEHGGQRMRAKLPADPAAAARAALRELGWTVVPSRRDDEVLGVIHDNTAMLRWSDDGWWARVDQRSEVVTREQLPHWDHPWEALRLLHLVAPDAGPAVGWKPFPPIAEQWEGERATAALASIEGWKPPDDAAEVVDDHLLVHVATRLIDLGRVRHRLRQALRVTPRPAMSITPDAARPGLPWPPAVGLDGSPPAAEPSKAVDPPAPAVPRGVVEALALPDPDVVLDPGEWDAPALGLQLGHDEREWPTHRILARARQRVLALAVAERRDPYTVLPPQVVFAEPKQRADWRDFRRPLHSMGRDDPFGRGLVEVLARSWRSRRLDDPAVIVEHLPLLVRLQPPGVDLLLDARWQPLAGPDSVPQVQRWWSAHGLSWLDELARKDP